MTVNRRSLLKAAGLAAVLDVEAVAAEAGPDGDSGAQMAGGPGDGEADGVVTSPSSPFGNLPPLDDLEGGVMASFARAAALDGRRRMPLLPGADAVESVVASDAAVTVGYGGDDRDRVVDRLRAEGYREGEAIAGRASFVVRGRGRLRLVVPGDDVTAVGRGTDYGAVSAVLGAALAEDPAPAASDLATARELLGGGAAVAVEVPADDGAAGGRPTDSATIPGDRPPVVSGERVAAADPGVSLRRVAVYPSRAASLAARESDWGAWPAEDVERTEVVRYGRAVVRDATATDASVLEG